MIRKTIFCVCLIMLLARCGYGANPNGNDWQQLDSDGKAMYILGFMNGSNHVVERNTVDIQLVNYCESKTEKEASAFSRGWAEMKKIQNIFLKRFSLYNISALQIVEGIDILYKDFKNKSIYVDDSVYVVKKQIQGTSPEDIEKILIFLRSKKENIEILNIRDRNGEIINSIQFP